MKRFQHIYEKHTLCRFNLLEFQYGLQLKFSLENSQLEISSKLNIAANVIMRQLMCKVNYCERQTRAHIFSSLGYFLLYL